MMVISVLLSLPPDVAVYICSEWLGIVGITFLDSALCSSRLRLEFLEMLSSELLLLSSLEQGGLYTKGCMNYVYARKIRLRKLHLNWQILNYVNTNVECSINFDNIHNVSVCDLRNIPGLAEIMNRCHNMIEFECDSKTGPVAFCSLKPLIVSQLTSVIVGTALSDKITPVCTHLAAHCRKLRKLILSDNCSDSIDEDLMSNILIANPDLEHINIKVNERLLNVIVQYCKSLRHLRLYANSISLSGISKVVTGCPNLKWMNLVAPTPDSNTIEVDYTIDGSTISFSIKNAYFLADVNGSIEGVTYLLINHIPFRNSKFVQIVKKTTTLTVINLINVLLTSDTIRCVLDYNRLTVFAWRNYYDGSNDSDTKAFLEAIDNRTYTYLRELLLTIDFLTVEILKTIITAFPNVTMIYFSNVVEQSEKVFAIIELVKQQFIEGRRIKVEIEFRASLKMLSVDGDVIDGRLIGAYKK